MEFEVHGIENIEGATIDVTMEIYDLWDDIVYPLPLGRFVVKSCDKQADEDVRKVIAYDELKSSILDKDWTEKANEFLYLTPILYPMMKTNLFFLLNYTVGDVYTKRIGTPVNLVYSSESTDYEHYPFEPIKVKTSRGDMWMTFKETHSFYGGIQLDPEAYYRLGDFPITETYEYVRGKVDSFMERYQIEVDKDIFDSRNRNWVDFNICTPTQTMGYGEELSKIWGYATNLEELRVSQVTGIALYYDSELTNRYDSMLISNQFHDFTFKPQKIEILDMEMYEIKSELRDFTPRKILSAVYELEASFGRIDRETHNIENIPLPENALYPSEDLFPSEDLYPSENCDIVDRSLYKTAQFSDRYVKPFGKIEYEYKTLDDEGKEILEKGTHVIDASNENTYEMMDNWVLHNTVQTKEQVEALVENMAQKIPSYEYCPAKIEAKGLPYLEAGDAISVYGRKDAFDTIIMRRTLSGIQSLTDVYESR